MSNKGSRAPLAGRKNEDWEDEAAKELAEAEDDAPKPSAAALAAAALLAGENDEEDDEDEEDEEGVMVRILPYVFIGDAYAACNEALLKEVCARGMHFLPI